MADRFLAPAPPPDEGVAAQPLWRKLAWFAGLAVLSGASVAVAAYALRALLFLG